MTEEEKSIIINRLETNIEFHKDRIRESKSPLEIRTLRESIDRIRKKIDTIKGII